MPMTCTICKHPQRAAMEAALVMGRSLRDIARQAGVSKDSIARHRSTCMPEEIRQAQAAREEAHGLAVLEQLQAANAVVLGIIDAASKEPIDAASEGLSPAEARAERKDLHVLTLQAVDRWHKQLELAARLQGDLQQDGTTITIEVVQHAVEQGQERARAFEQQHGIMPGKPRLLDAG